MNSITATKARSSLFKIFKDTLKNHLPVRVTSKDGTVVILPEEDYQNLLETAELLSIPGFVESIQKADEDIEKGDLVSFDDIFDA